MAMGSIFELYGKNYPEKILYARIGSKCMVYGCENYKVQPYDPKSFFRFPKDKDLLLKWVAACKHESLFEASKTKEPEYFHKRYRVCQDHFEISCFKVKHILSRGLVPGSVPTLNLYQEPNKMKNVQDDTIEIKTEIEIVEDNLVDYQLPSDALENSCQSITTDVPNVPQNVMQSSCQKITTDVPNDPKEVLRSSWQRSESSAWKQTMESELRKKEKVIDVLHQEISELKFQLKECKKKLSDRSKSLTQQRKRNMLLKQKLKSFKRVKVEKLESGDVILHSKTARLLRK